MKQKLTKSQILKEARAWNPQTERVTANIFKSHPFFDPEDRAQVKYEMLRAREVEKAPLTKTCLKFGFSRESYGHILKRFFQEGMSGLFGHKRGRKGPVKATEELREFIHSERARDRSLTAEELAERCNQRFGVTISRRTVFRIFAENKEDKKKRR